MLTDYTDNLILRWLLLGETMPAPPSVYLALFTAAPTKSTGGTEVAGGSYGRVLVPVASWAVSGSPRVGANSAIVNFPTPTSSWGAIVAAGVFDASSGGNLVAFASTNTIAPIPGQPVIFNLQNFTITGS